MMSLRRIAVVAGLTAATLALSVADASAWYCRADSRNAYGWGASHNLRTAKRIALRQCAVRTRVGNTCWISWCN